MDIRNEFKTSRDRKYCKFNIHKTRTVILWAVAVMFLNVLAGLIIHWFISKLSENCCLKYILAPRHYLGLIQPVSNIMFSVLTLFSSIFGFMIYSKISKAQDNGLANYNKLLIKNIFNWTTVDKLYITTIACSIFLLMTSYLYGYVIKWQCLFFSSVLFYFLYLFFMLKKFHFMSSNIVKSEDYWIKTFINKKYKKGIFDDELFIQYIIKLAKEGAKRSTNSGNIKKYSYYEDNIKFCVKFLHLAINRGLLNKKNISDNSDKLLFEKIFKFIETLAEYEGVKFDILLCIQESIVNEIISRKRISMCRKRNIKYKKGCMIGYSAIFAYICKNTELFSEYFNIYYGNIMIPLFIPSFNKLLGEVESEIDSGNFFENKMNIETWKMFDKLLWIYILLGKERASELLENSEYAEIIDNIDNIWYQNNIRPLLTRNAIRVKLSSEEDNEEYID